MQPDPLVGAELLEQGLAHERVREAQTPGAALDLVDELGRDGLVEVVDRGVFVDLHDRGDEVGIELAAEHGRGAQEVVGRFGKAREPLPDNVAHPFGEAGLARSDRPDPHAVDLDERAGLDEVPQHLGDEERVAVGLGREAMRELDPRRLEGIAARGLEERAHAGFVEAAQRDALGARGAVQIGEAPRRAGGRGRCRCRGT